MKKNYKNIKIIIAAVLIIAFIGMMFVFQNQLFSLVSTKQNEYTYFQSEWKEGMIQIQKQNFVIENPTYKSKPLCHIPGQNLQDLVCQAKGYEYSMGVSIDPNKYENIGCYDYPNHFDGSNDYIAGSLSCASDAYYSVADFTRKNPVVLDDNYSIINFQYDSQLNGGNIELYAIVNDVQQLVVDDTIVGDFRQGDRISYRFFMTPGLNNTPMIDGQNIQILPIKVGGQVIENLNTNLIKSEIRNIGSNDIKTDEIGKISLLLGLSGGTEDMVVESDLSCTQDISLGKQRVTLKPSVESNVELQYKGDVGVYTCDIFVRSVDNPSIFSIQEVQIEILESSSQDNVTSLNSGNVQSSTSSSAASNAGNEVSGTSNQQEESNSGIIFLALLFIVGMWGGVYLSIRKKGKKSKK